MKCRSILAGFPMPSVTELKRLVEERRRLLAEAEATLEKALRRDPEIGDFVQSTLTRFYGRVTKVTSRPHGRPWVEITPYLAPTLPGARHLTCSAIGRSSTIPRLATGVRRSRAARRSSRD